MVHQSGKAGSVLHTVALGSACSHTHLLPALRLPLQYLEKGGRMGRGQSAAKGCTDPVGGGRGLRLGGATVCSRQHQHCCLPACCGLAPT